LNCFENPEVLEVPGGATVGLPGSYFYFQETIQNCRLIIALYNE